MKITGIMKRIIRQFRRDKRTLALMIAAPILVLSLLWLVLESDAYEPAIAAVEAPEIFAEILTETNADVFHMTVSEASEAIHNQEIDAYLQWENGEPLIYLEGSNPEATGAVMQSLQHVFQEMRSGSMPEAEMVFLYGSGDVSLFDHTGPVLIGFFIFFFVFILGGVSFLRERTQGTLERLLATPLRRWEIVAGYLAGFGLFTILQTAIIASYAIFILNIYMAGSFWYVLLVTFLLAMTALSLGTLLSTYAKNEFQMIQFIPVIIVPQVFFSGIFSLETVKPPWLEAISYVMPLTYGAEALRDIMLRGQGFTSFQQNIYVLTGFSVLFISLNILALKRHRQL